MYGYYEINLTRIFFRENAMALKCFRIIDPLWPATSLYGRLIMRSVDAFFVVMLSINQSKPMVSTAMTLICRHCNVDKAPAHSMNAIIRSVVSKWLLPV